MPDVITLNNSMPVALFGMFALWAAASNRHWFLRTAVVAAAILITLLVPAYEIVLLLTLETAVVVMGMALWRRCRRSPNSSAATATSTLFPLRVSMETLMLCVVIVAVVTTLAARWPALRPEDWYQFALSGAHSGVIALVCVWLIFGHPRWWVRLIAALPLILLLSFSLICLQWAGHIVSVWYRVPTQNIFEYMQMARRDIWPATLSWMSAVALGTAVLCVWLFLMQHSGWFDPFLEQRTSTATEQKSSANAHWRLAALALFGIVAIFPLILFYEMLTPAPIPMVKLPKPNGFDDFLAAGRMIDPAAARTLQNPELLTPAQLNAELAKHTAVFERMQLGLNRPSWNPFAFTELPPDDSFALIQLFYALGGRIDYFQRSGDKDQELATYKLLLQLAQAESRGTGIQYYNAVFSMHEPEAYARIWNLADKISARTYADLSLELQQLDADRDPLAERLKRQRIIDENSGWQRLIEATLADWSNREIYKWQCDEERKHVAQLRMLILKLALRAYELDHDRLPQSLSELVPNYLPAVPDDPFSNAAFKYRPKDKDNGYILYSFGPDRDDDNGQPLVEEKGDLTDAKLFPSR